MFLTTNNVRCETASLGVPIIRDVLKGSQVFGFCPSSLELGSFCVNGLRVFLDKNFEREKKRAKMKSPLSLKPLKILKPVYIVWKTK